MTRRTRLVKKAAPRREVLRMTIDEAVKGMTTPSEWEAKEANLTQKPITDQRQPTYGHPALNFARQAIMWSGLLANKLIKPITPQEVALMMAACKLVRLVETPTHEDSIIDVGGYMSCLEQVNANKASGTEGSGIRSETVAHSRALRED